MSKTCFLSQGFLDKGFSEHITLFTTGPKPVCTPNATLFFRARALASLQGAPAFVQGALQPLQKALALHQGTPASLQGVVAFVQGTLQPLQKAPALRQGAPASLQGVAAFVQGALHPLQRALEFLQRVRASLPGADT